MILHLDYIAIAKTKAASLYEKVDECRSLEKTNENEYNRTFSAKHKLFVRTGRHDPAYLHCPIPQFPNQIAAWTRLSDRAILTHGEVTFTSDPRFQLSLKENEHDWILIIRRAELSDSGCYLCEISTEPKSTVYTVYLEVDGEFTRNLYVIFITML
ncbi:unnamed protein product [Enterobius vermicularis]|uniref:IGv domain-containing protein n=1 Tax=Enterobius vermicularis TaxID=51028 RepID=A0A0N4VRI0_ENTVE|nr:unnamed protein product [Enterobius vermicularis]